MADVGTSRGAGQAVPVGAAAVPVAGFGPRDLARGLLVACAGLVIAAIGLTHPLLLTPDTAASWRLGHLLLLPGFPLLAVALWVVVRGERGPASWGVRVLAVAYSLLYGALDSIAGIGAPEMVIRSTQRGDPRAPIEDLFFIGDKLGAVGVYSLGAAALLAAAVVFLRSANPLAPVGGVVVALGCYPFELYHVFPPRGVLAMVTIGLGLGLIEAARTPLRSRATAPPPAQQSEQVS